MIKNIIPILNGKQNDMLTLWPYIRKYRPDMDAKGNLFFSKGKAPYDCFVAHLDTVHTAAPKPFFMGEYCVSLNGNGIGGDDKCGIIACLDLIENLDNVKIVFFVEEEKGAQGSRNFDYKFFSDCKYIIEIDRRGETDFIQRSGGTELCTKEFTKEFIACNPKFKKEQGTFTDVNVLRSHVPLCMANISSGYYNPHRADEFINFKHLQQTINALYRFAHVNQNKVWTFEVEKSYWPRNNYAGGHYNKKDDDIIDLGDATLFTDSHGNETELVSEKPGQSWYLNGAGVKIYY